MNFCLRTRDVLCMEIFSFQLNNLKINLWYILHTLCDSGCSRWKLTFVRENLWLSIKMLFCLTVRSCVKCKQNEMIWTAFSTYIELVLYSAEHMSKRICKLLLLCYSYFTQHPNFLGIGLIVKTLNGGSWLVTSFQHFYLNKGLRTSPSTGLSCLQICNHTGWHRLWPRFFRPIWVWHVMNLQALILRETHTFCSVIFSIQLLSCFTKYVIFHIISSPIHTSLIKNKRNQLILRLEFNHIKYLLQPHCQLWQRDSDRKVERGLLAEQY